jgi:hypothetical protein
MSKYEIKDYSYDQAKKLKVVIVPSTKPKYKIDILLRNGDLLTSIGAKNYSDYPTYIETRGQKYADERRRLYHIRHKKDISKIGSRGWWASQILWIAIYFIMVVKLI